jgi:hypothetical protein
MSSYSAHDSAPKNDATDGDGLSDGDEVNVHNTNPLDPDTDGDGLPDGWEVRYDFNPRVVQTDGIHGVADDPDDDGLTNLQEYQHGTDPFNEDTDDDGLEDGDEVNVHNTNPLLEDTDGDGLTDGDEVALKAVWPCLDPLVWDCDGDMLPDGWELQYGLNPCECAATNSPAWDADNDGLGLLDEYRYCTDPTNPDTDGDGVRDGDEVPHSPGSCPCDPDDEGNPANCVTLSLTVGDPSSSNSERWNFEVFEVATGKAVVRHCDDGFGTPGSAEYALVKGKAYTFKLRWVATDPEYDDTPKPDYDWQALINDSARAGAREGLYGTGAFIVEDPDRLLTDEKHGNEFDITVGKTGRIIVPRIVTETVATSPPNRARKTIGVGEEVSLTLLPDTLGNVIWTKTSGGGSIEFGESVVFTAPDCEGTTILAANSQGVSLPVVFSVIEPSSVVFENNSIVNAFAPPSQNFYSIKYFANVYFMPDEVNFGKMKVCEGYAQTQTEPGYFRDYPPPPHPSSENAPRGVGGSIVVEGKGTKADWENGGDEITGTSQYVSMVPIRDGYAWHDIQWKYKVGEGAYKQICTVRQDYRLTGNSTNATLRITKGASGAEISTGEVEAHFINP